MGLTAPLPAKVDSDLGRVKTGLPVADLDRELTAAELEAIKTRIVQIATAVGLRDGSTADSLEARIGAVAAPVAKQEVRIATTVAGTLASSFANGQTIDGKTLATGDRILIKNQASSVENGVYVVAASGAPTRASDFDAAGDLTNGALVHVITGNANGGTLWQLDQIAPTPGVTSITFTRCNAITAGTGVVVSGTGLQTVAADISGSLAQDVGTAASAGASGKLADAGHVHVLTEAVLRTVAGTLTAALGLNAQDLSNVGSATITKALVKSGAITPTTLAANTNDWSPTGLSTAAQIRVAASSLVQVTGLLAGTAWQEVTLHNVGSSPIFFRRESAASSAANRFADRFVLLPGQSRTLIYDGTTSRWRPFGENGTTHLDPRWTATQRTDLFEGVTAAGVAAWLNDSSGTGAAAAAATSAGAGGGLIAGRPGLVQITSGTTNAGVGCMLTLLAIGNINVGPQLGGGIVVLRYAFKLDQLSNVTDEFKFAIGAANNRALAGATGMWFEYDRLTSVNWRIKTGGGGASTSSVAVTTGWHLAEIVVDPGGTSCEFFMDGTSLGTLSTGLPNAAWQPCQMTIIKSAGTTPVTAVIDWADYLEIFSTARG